MFILQYADSYKQFGTNWIVVLLSVESQTVHIYSGCKVCNKHLECCQCPKNVSMFCLYFYLYLTLSTRWFSRLFFFLQVFQTNPRTHWSPISKHNINTCDYM
jgi:hypothetical protein